MSSLPKNYENKLKTKKMKRKLYKINVYILYELKQILAADFLKMKPDSNTNKKVEPCIDKRLKKVFVEHNLITIEDLNRVSYVCK